MHSTFDPEAVLHAPGVWNENGQVVLNSGLVTGVKIDMPALIRTPQLFYPVMGRVSELAEAIEADVIVPVANGGVEMVRAAQQPTEQYGPVQLPRVVESHKIGKQVFDILRPTDREALNEADNIIIFDDVVTTGGTPYRLAERVRGLSPYAALHLVTIMRRAVLNPKFTNIFQTQHFLIEQEIPAWRPNTPDQIRP